MTSTQSPAARQVQTPDRVARHTLGNGLGVIVVSDHTTPVAAIQLTYRVGSRNELPGRTGFAHLFEHLMFQGSANVKSGEYMQTMGQVGGSPNAATYFDWTIYHVEVPVGALELALWMEADRMAGLPSVLSQVVLDTEKEVVQNERRESDKQPYGDAWELLYAAGYPKGHPYSWMPIGAVEDVDGATLVDVQDFFARHYGPNNCVLAICGDVTAERGFELAEKYFGGIPRNDRISATPSTAAAPLDREVRLQAPKPGPVPAVFALYSGPAMTDPEFAALEVACTILGQGEASRLVDRLVRRDQLAREVESGTSRLRGEVTGAVVVAHLNSDTEMSQFEKALDEEIARFADEGPTEAEVRRAVAQTERQLWESVETAEGVAGLYSESEAFRPGYDPVADALAELNSLTPEQVRAAAARWLRPNSRVVLTYEGGAPDEFFDDFDGDFDSDVDGDFDSEDNR